MESRSGCWGSVGPLGPPCEQGSDWDSALQLPLHTPLAPLLPAVNPQTIKENEMIKKRTSCHAQAWTLTLSLSAGWSFCLVLKSFRNQKNIHRAKWKKTQQICRRGSTGWRGVQLINVMDNWLKKGVWSRLYLECCNSLPDNLTGGKFYLSGVLSCSTCKWKDYFPLPDTGALEDCPPFI